MVNSKLEVKLSKHAQRRIRQRKIQKQIIEKMIIDFIFNNNIKQFSQLDEILLNSQNLNIIITIRNSKIHIITAIDKENFTPKSGTLAIAI